MAFLATFTPLSYYFGTADIKTFAYGMGLTVSELLFYAA